MPRDRFRSAALASTDSDIAVRVASRPEEIKEASKLVYRAYLRCGLIEPNPFAMRVTPYHLLPTTEVFVAVLRGEVICTVSLVRSGELGLPMESIYGKEVAWRREHGISVAEASCLADRRRSLVRSFPLVARLMSFTIQCASHRGIDQLLIAVHPKHGRFYQRFLGFQQVAEEKTYEAVRGKPAVAMALDISRLSVDHPKAHKRVFGVSFSEEDLEYRPISDEFRAELSIMVNATYVPDPHPDAAFCSREADRICA